jgi:DNA-binding CsgD family transcriptional regulator
VTLRGRDFQLRQASDLIDLVLADGTARLMIVEGEPGIGKSAFLAEVVALAEGRGFAVGSGKAEELDQIAPGSSLMSTLMYGEKPIVSPEEMAALYELREQRFWMVEQLAGILESRALEQPLALALDDVQWVDPMSRFSLRTLPARLRGSPVLFVLASRGEDDVAAQEIGRSAARVAPVDWIRLGPLSAEAISQIAEDILRRPAAEQERDLLDGAGGNPFLAVEMLHGLAAGEHAPQDGSVPPSIVAGVRGQLRVLPTSTLRFLQVGAVLGRRFTLSDAAALLGVTATQLLPDLELSVRDLLTDDGTYLQFRHDLVCQAVYADIPASARRALHREAALRLMATGGRPIDAARHMLLGAMPRDTEAIGLLRQAAAEVRAMMPNLAADLMLRAMELTDPSSPEHLSLGEQAVSLLAAAHRGFEALEVGKALRGAHPDPLSQATVVAAVARPLWNLGMVTEMQQQAGQAAAQLGLPEATRARLLAAQALAMSRGEDLQTAQARGEEALHSAIRAEDLNAQTTAVWALGEIALNAGYCARALDRFIELRSLDPSFRAEEITALQHMDDFATSGRRLDEARLGPGSTDEPSPKIAALTWAQGQHDMALGRIDDAEAEFRSITELDDELREQSHDVACWTMLSWIAQLRGDAVNARASLEAARNVFTSRPTPWPAAQVGFTEAWLAHAANNSRQAVLIMRREGFAANLMRWRSLRTSVARAVGFALAGGDDDLARDLTNQATAYAERNPGVVTAAGLAKHTAGLLGDDPDLLGEATEMLRSGPQPLVFADAATAYGLALTRLQRKDEAQAVLAQALDTYRATGAAGEAARVSRLLEGGVRRRVRAPVRPEQGWAALTATEKRVARLIADGHTNRSAAAELYLSPHTVNTHLGSIFRKLGVTSRVQLARLVLQEQPA